MSTALPPQFRERIKGNWFNLPMKLRRRWWLETDYGKKEPSAELTAAIIAAFDNPEGED